MSRNASVTAESATASEVCSWLGLKECEKILSLSLETPLLPGSYQDDRWKFKSNVHRSYMVAAFPLYSRALNFSQTL